MTKRTYSLAILACLCAQTSGRLIAQGPPPGPDMAIDAATVITVIDAVAKNLADAYVFPDVAGKMVTAIRDRQQRHEYEAITSARTLAETLTAHLRDVSHDKHL